MDLLEKIDLFLGEGESDGKSFPAKKKKDDKDSDAQSADAEKKVSDLESDANAEGEDPYDPETDLDKEKKQKALKKKASLHNYTPPYAAS